MVFTCTDSINKVYITTSGNTDFTFIYNKDSSDTISLSNFRITVEDVSVQTGKETNKLLIRSKNGLPYPNGCSTELTDQECFRGYVCSTKECKRCHYSCAKCNSISSSRSSCSKCSPLSNIQEPDPTTGICPINYIDLSQFKDINIDIYPKGNEFNERATIGLWLFFADLSGRSNENDIYHIVLKDRIVISLVPGDNKLTAYCHAFEDLYRKVTSDTKLYSYYSDKNSEYVVYEVIPGENGGNQKDGLDTNTMNGKWFHISCGISFDHKEFYIKSVVNGINSPISKPLSKEKLYPGSGISDIKNDFYFRHIINNGEPLTLSLKNFGNSNAKIYARHLMFFKEYINPDMQYMYFDFTQVTNFAEILYQLPLDELVIESSYKIYGYQYDSGGKVTSPTGGIVLESSHSDREDFYPPLNFYRLRLNTPNNAYKRIDLKDGGGQSETSLDTDSPSDGLYFYDDNRLLNCENGYFYSKTSSSVTCNSAKCASGSMTYPGVSQQTGYCDRPCLPSETCDQTKLTNRNSYDYNNNNFCKDYTTSYNLFFNCTEIFEKFYLQYSGFYNSQLLQINLDQPLRSYIIEFWFYPDFFLQAKARQTQFTFPTYTKNYFFHSNVMDCYFVQTDRLVPYLYDSKTIIKVETLYNSNEWNKFVIHGKYLKESDDYIKTVYVNHAFNQPFAFAASKASSATNLSSITFCENKCQDINRENIHWTTGYYRDLRIWDGDLASYSEVVQYNDFYPVNDFTNRINSILCYFPLSNQYIANNKIRDLDGRSNRCTYVLEVGDYNLQKYNYGGKFDIIGGNSLHQKYSKHGSDPAFIDSCDNGCERCWERTFWVVKDVGKEHFATNVKQDIFYQGENAY